MFLLRLVFLNFVTFSLLTVLGCGSAKNSNETSNPKIVNGVLKEENFPEVSELYIDRGSVFSACSGTWIGKYTLLTAAHCIFDNNQVVGYNSVIALTTYNGKFIAQESSFIIPHPNYIPGNYIPSTAYPNLLTNAYDIALVIFNQPFSGIPAVISPRPPIVGDLLTLVGFGSHGYGGTEFGTGYLGYTQIDALDELRIFWRFDGGEESNTCFGDSGGPAYVDYGNGPRLIGVTSAGTSRNCAEGDISIDMRIDVYLEWIISVAGADLNIDDTLVYTAPPSPEVIPNDPTHWFW